MISLWLTIREPVCTRALSSSTGTGEFHEKRTSNGEEFSSAGHDDSRAATLDSQLSKASQGRGTNLMRSGFIKRRATKHPPSTVHTFLLATLDAKITPGITRGNLMTTRVIK